MSKELKELEKEYKVLFHANGGRTGTTTKISLPKSWVNDMGISCESEESRKVILTYDEDTKTIKISPKNRARVSNCLSNNK